MTIDDLRQLVIDDPWSGTKPDAVAALLVALDVVEAADRVWDGRNKPSALDDVLDAFDAALAGEVAK